jgi:hypothetical protein
MSTYICPIPPHWDHLARLPVAATAVEVAATVEVTKVVPGAEVVCEPPAGLTATPPDPATDVVRDPLSI